MKKIFIAFFVLIPVAFLVSGCVQQEQPIGGERDGNITEALAGRNESVVIKGNDDIAIRGLAFPPYPEQLVLARDMGANYITYGHWIVPDMSGNIVPPGRGSWSSDINETRERIRMLHDEGFKVWLYIRTPLQPTDANESTSEFTFELNPNVFSGLSTEARQRFLDALKPEILEVAKMAEEEKVEMFGPVAADQLYLVLEPRSDSDFSYRWTDALIPEVREVYSGDLAQKIDLNPDTSQNKKIIGIANFTGWNWVSSDVFGSCDGFPGGQGEVDSYDEWRHIYTSLLGVLQAKKAESGAKGIIFGPETLGIDSSAHRIIMAEKGYSSIDDIPLGDWEKARARAWDMMLNDTVGKVDGYFFWSWWPGCELPDYEYDKAVNGQVIRSRKSPGIQGILPYETIKKYYSG